MNEERFDKFQLNSMYNTPADWPLTEEEQEQGYHFCWDWDGLFIGPDSREFESCTCEEWLKEETPLCPNCNGSGEGMHDGTKCSSCEGTGEEKC